MPIIQKNLISGTFPKWYGDIVYIISQFPLIAEFYMIYNQRKRAVYYFMAWVMFGYLNNILKLGSQSPRPFWIGPDIKVFSCTN